MDDRLRETLSAMMDDEADELSVRRVLSHDDQEDVRAQWQRWQQVRDLMHEGGLPLGDYSISDRVRDSLESGGRVQLADGGSAGVGRGLWRWSGIAMVALGLLIGFGVGSGWRSDEPAGLVAISTGGAYGAQNVPEGSVPEVALQGLDEEQWQQLSRYLLEHAQHNSVGVGRGSVGYARLASASGPGY